MTERDRKQKGTDWRDALDRELDAALARYASIEPRAGLEQRILANLRIEGQKVPHRGLWHWSALAAMAVALIVAAWVAGWKSLWPRPDNKAQQPSTMTPSSRPGKQTVSNGERNGVRPHRPMPVRRSAGRRGHPPVMVAAQPKQEQFPSSRPLSEQERILADYVASYPEHAVLVAEARMDALRRDRLEEMKAFPSDDPPTDSEERNSDTTQR
ncbi:MAG: hypothetical protein LAO24_09795 [Acidobacteriia bacterium]|nr:hypothetical protein [Terriglobia bacterium]